MLRRTVAIAAVLGLVLVVGGAKQKKDPAFTHRLEDVWNDTAHQPTPFKRLLIIGITDDIDTRKQFENKFVSHLRGYGVDGVTSYSLVYDLTVVEDETEIVQAIEERKIDGAISVRVVPLGKDDSSWTASWRQTVEVDGDLRELIDESLPVSRQKSKQWGVEVALWDTGDWDHIWAARTNPYTRKELGRAAGAFVQDVIGALQGAKLLEPKERE